MSQSLLRSPGNGAEEGPRKMVGQYDSARLSLFLFDWNVDFSSLRDEEIHGSRDEFGAYRNLMGLVKTTGIRWRAEIPQQSGGDYFKEVVSIDPPIIRMRYGRECLLDACSGRVLLYRTSDFRAESMQPTGEFLWHHRDELLTSFGVHKLRANIFRALRSPDGYYFVVYERPSEVGFETFDQDLKSLWVLKDWVVDILSSAPLRVATGLRALTLDASTGRIIESKSAK